ncbi:DoxX family protein [Rhodococcus opacus M213]|uniref:DoxX family protein n=2 Tax=Rhodococcus opacus TaxID=37919 RepID=K8XJW2_RHOOP|nr:DoxX family protein [Rhodococcus opacus M213]
MAVIAVLCELLAAVLLAAGIATPFGVAVGASTMLVAAVATNLKAQARWNSAGGGEYPLVLALVLATLGFTGPGSLSVDAALGLPSSDADVRVGIAVVVVALAAASVPIARTARAVRQSREQQMAASR